VTIRREPLDSPVAAGLIAALNRELSAEYPEPGATHFKLDPAEVVEGAGTYVVAWIDGMARGCGAFRRLDTGSAELKRMYVEPGFRGRGVGGALLKALETEARRLGIHQLVLETGVRQAAAIHLYRGQGYLEAPPFGEYVNTPTTSYCMAKEL
jgi:GNAT superfamily N-acetyltransferase